MNTVVQTFTEYEDFRAAIDAAEVLNLDYTVNKETKELKPLVRTLLPTPKFSTAWTLELIFNDDNLSVSNIDSDDEQK